MVARAGCIFDVKMISDYCGPWPHPVYDEYFIRQKSEKNLINENSKQGLIDNLQSLLSSSPTRHNSTCLTSCALSLHTGNNDSLCKMLHRFAKLTELDLRTPLLLATVWFSEDREYGRAVSVMYSLDS